MMISRKPAVFLDRDGVLTIERGYAISLIDEMEIFSYAAECVRRIREAGYYAIVVTNQSAVAKGLFTIEELMEMNHKLKSEVGVDAIYYCPHHPEGKVSEYTKICNCRKPGTGMIDQAMKDFDIDMTSSYIVGDRACDIILGQNAGIKTVLLDSGYGSERLEEDCSPDFIMKDLTEFTEYLTKNRQ